MDGFDIDGDNDFDFEDAAVIGAIMGFAEESMHQEEQNIDDIDTDIKVDPSNIKDDNLRILYNTDPDMFNYIVNLVRKQAMEWKTHTNVLAKRLTLKNSSPEIKAELKALEETEKLLNETK